MRAASTKIRLHQAGEAIGLPAQEVAGFAAAFSHILRLRLTQQSALPDAAAPAGNGLKPATLHDLDRAILRESLKQARRLQQRLKLNYSL